MSDIINSEEIQIKPEGNVPEAKDSSVDIIKLLSEDQRSFIQKKGFKDIDSLVKSYENLEGKLGRRFDEMTNEDILALNKKLGVPEKEEDYGISLPEELQEHRLLKGITKDLLSSGIPKDNASKLVKAILDKEIESLKESEAHRSLRNSEEKDKLEKEFGAAFSEKETLMKKALKEYGGDDMVKLLSESGLTNNSLMFKMLAKVGETLSEDEPVKGDSNRSFGISPEEAEERISKMDSDKAIIKILSNPGHPEHNATVEKRDKLFKLKAGIKV